MQCFRAANSLGQDVIEKNRDKIEIKLSNYRSHSLNSEFFSYGILFKVGPKNLKIIANSYNSFFICIMLINEFNHCAHR